MDSIKVNKTVNESIYFKRLSNGMKCYIIPKLGYVEKQAMLGVNYGSVDYVFSAGGKDFAQPAGVAHFIEHKMFENKEINVFERFMGLKASVNAFTNFTNTAYYFTGSENFYECLRLLLEFVQRPHFTDENVEKEKPIIAQEIEMYEDNPFWVMYFNLLGALYKESPIRQKIAEASRGYKISRWKHCIRAIAHSIGRRIWSCVAWERLTPNELSKLRKNICRAVSRWM